MGHVNRLLYAFALTVLISMVFIFLSAIVAPDAMAAFISQPYWVAIFVLSYLVAPFLGRYIKRE
jgi:cellulose synthase/poly-beta-1,6-N-acetylglucosamine synthase-like glycosyltransferase